MHWVHWSRFWKRTWCCRQYFDHHHRYDQPLHPSTDHDVACRHAWEVRRGKPHGHDGVQRPWPTEREIQTDGEATDKWDIWIRGNPPIHRRVTSIYISILSMQNFYHVGNLWVYFLGGVRLVLLGSVVLHLLQLYKQITLGGKGQNSKDDSIIVARIAFSFFFFVIIIFLGRLMIGTSTIILQFLRASCH